MWKRKKHVAKDNLPTSVSKSLEFMKRKKPTRVGKSSLAAQFFLHPTCEAS